MEFINQIENSINNISNVSIKDDTTFQLINVGELLINQPNENKQMKECERNEKVKTRVFRKDIKHGVLQYNQ